MEGWHGDWNDRSGTPDDNYVNYGAAVSAGTISKPSVDIKVEKTFSFNQENILDLIVDYLEREQKVTVTRDQLKVNISDSTTAGYMDSEYVPARIKSISVVVPADDQK